MCFADEFPQCTAAGRIAEVQAAAQMHYWCNVGMKPARGSYNLNKFKISIMHPGKIMTINGDILICAI